MYTENITDLRRAESIRGIPIGVMDIQFLEDYCRKNNILKVKCGCCHELSKPKSFFFNKQSEFTFLKNGKEKSFWEVDVDNQEFIAFSVSKQVLSVYGYFHYECD